MSTTSSSSPWPVRAYQPQHESWPYTEVDFTRHDSSDDIYFYNDARLVTHIDDAAIETLGQYYETVLPRKGRLLDFCSSWISHYPTSVTEAAQKGDLQIIGMGMNKQELAANPVLRADSRLATDLNADPDVYKALSTAQLISTDDENGKLAASTCVVSIDYLTNPRKVLESLREATVPGGTVHLAISNRCFPTKVVSRWLRISEEERLQMVGDYLHFSGWKKIEIVELSDGTVKDNGGSSNNGNASQGLASLMKFVGVGMSRDPLWVVRATRQDQ